MTVEEFHDYIGDKKDQKVLVLVRGIPGTGKSTIAKELAQKFTMKHFEADMYFVDANGMYDFNYEEIQSAHSWCKWTTDWSLGLGKNVVVSNTFVKWFEIQPYQTLAKKYGYELIIVEATGDYLNVHGVPPETLERMKKNFEPEHNHFTIGA